MALLASANLRSQPCTQSPRLQRGWPLQTLMLLFWVGGVVSGGEVAIAQTPSAPSVTPAPTPVPTPAPTPPPAPASPQPAAKPKPSSPQQRSPQTPSPQAPEAQKLTEQAQEHYAEGAFAAALKTLETLLAMQKQPVQQAETLNLMGLVYDRLGQFDAAVRSYQQALDAYNTLQRDQPQIAKRGEARTLNNLGALYAAADRNPEALGFLERSLGIFRELKARESEAVTLRNLGSLYLQAGRGKDAIAALETSLKLETELNRPVQIVELLDRLSSIYLNAGAVDEALGLLQRAFTLVEPSDDIASKLALLTRIGELYENTRRVDAAIATYQNALDLVKKTPDAALGEAKLPVEGRLRDRMAQVLADAGQIQSAIEQYENVLAIAQTLQDPLGQAQVLISLGDLQRRTQSLDAARQRYTQALALAKPLQNPLLEGRLLSGLAVVARDAGRWDEALKLAQQALAAQEQQLTSPEEQAQQKAGKAITLNLLGDVHRQQRQYDQAATAYQQSLNQQDPQNLLLRGTNLNDLGAMLLALGRTKEAVAPLEQAIAIWEALGLESAAGQGRNPVEESYQQLTNTWLAQGNTGEALMTVEKWRSRLYRTFLDLRQPEQAPPTKSLNLQQLQQIAADQRATILVYDLTSQLAAPNADPKPDPKAKPKPKTDPNPKPDPKPKTDPKTDSKANPAINPEVNSPQTLRIWQLSATGAVAVKTVDISPEQRSRLQAPNANPADLQALAEILITPLADSLPQPDAIIRDADGVVTVASGGPSLIIVPPVSMQKLPWAALPLAGKTTIIDVYPLMVVPSLQVLSPRSPAQPNPAIAAPLIVGNPATHGPDHPLVSEQVKAIATLLGTEAFTGKAANLGAIAPKLAAANLIHLAVPQLNIANLGEALVFAPDPTAPGKAPQKPAPQKTAIQGMTPADILALPLQANLVVLQGLDANLDQPQTSESSLAQAFRAAGAETVLSSTGQASDAATRDLMKAFYQILKTEPSTSPVQALRQAMIQLRQQYPSPQDWAGFTIWGGNNPIAKLAAPISPTRDRPTPNRPTTPAKSNTKG